MRQRIFISSVQREFARERKALKEYIEGDPLLGRFFEVFIFENSATVDRRADEVYLSQIDSAAIYLALLGREYGAEDSARLSPTEREYRYATHLGRHRLVYVATGEDAARHPRMQALLARASAELVRRRFGSLPELLAQVYASLVDYLSATGAIRSGPFDGAACDGAGLDEISADKVREFLRRARVERGYVLDESTPLIDVLSHLNLLDHGKPSNAAVLLFGEAPQRHLTASEVKCMHFHGSTVTKPIPSYQIYKGTVFQLVDQAVDFVLSKLSRSVGTRGAGPVAPVHYDTPPQAIAEGIVNAVAHRDYASNASVQVMLFADRLEIWNPGSLPPGLSLQSLGRPHPSIPRNPLIAEPLFLAKYIEKAGSGTVDMFAQCASAGLRAPAFSLDAGGLKVTLPRAKAGTKSGPSRHQVGTKSALSRHQVMVLRKSLTEQPLAVLLAASGRSDRTKFRHQVLDPLLQQGLVRMTIPEKPRSSRQRYQTTQAGHKVLKQHGRREARGTQGRQ